MKQNTGKFNDILLNINIDEAGYKEGLSCFSAFDLPENLLDTLHEVLWDTPEIIINYQRVAEYAWSIAELIRKL